MGTHENKKVIFLAPIIRGSKGTYEKIFDDAKKEGFSRIRVDGEIFHVDSVKEEVTLERYEKHWIEYVIDRLEINQDNRQRITEAVEQSLHYGKGSLVLLDVEKEKEVLKSL